MMAEDLIATCVSDSQTMLQRGSAARAYVHRTSTVEREPFTHEVLISAGCLRQTIQYHRSPSRIHPTSSRSRPPCVCFKKENPWPMACKHAWGMQRGAWCVLIWVLGFLHLASPGILVLARWFISLCLLGRRLVLCNRSREDRGLRSDPADAQLCVTGRSAAVRGPRPDRPPPGGWRPLRLRRGLPEP
jgi:hypothetical protein